MLALLKSMKPSLISGLFASIAVIMGIMERTILVAKLAFDASDSAILKTLVEVNFHTFRYPVALLWLLRTIFGVLAVLCNALMLKYYVSSLKINGATKATVFTFSCNFVLTVLMPHSIFL